MTSRGINKPAGGAPGAVKRAMVFDFDGTVTDVDVFDSLFFQFADPAWLEAHAAYHKDECDLEEAYRKMTPHFRGGAEEVLAFLENRIGLREGFRELLDHLLLEKVRVMIVSNGFDFYIHYLLDFWGIDRKRLEVICHRARISRGRFLPSFRRHSSLKHAHCLIGKAEIIEQLKASGHSVAFCGDGYSDTPAARVADLVFARGHLARFCRAEKIAFHYLDNFVSVLRRLRREWR